MLYGGLRLRGTESIQANTNSQLFSGNDAHASTVVPRPFFLLPGYTRGYSLLLLCKTVSDARMHAV